MPARHPLGAQLEALQSDASTDSADSMSDHGTSAAAAATAAANTVAPMDAEPPAMALPGGQEEPDADEGQQPGHPHGLVTPAGMGAGVKAENNPPEKAVFDQPDRVDGDGRQWRAPSSSSSATSMGCPICLEAMREAFMTACGHSFCYQCISRHLEERQNCPSCQRAVDKDQVYPNFALNKLIMQMDATSLRPSSIVQQLRSSMEGDGSLGAQDIDALLAVLQQKKQALRSSERQLEIGTLRRFLVAARARKAAAMDVLRREMRLVDDDLNYVASQREQSAPSDDDLAETPVAAAGCPSQPCVGAQVPGDEAMERAGSSAALGSAQRGQRVDEHYEDLEAFYFDSRMRRAGEEGLGEFLETLTTVARCGRFRQAATLRYGDSAATSAIVASIEFDRDEEIFAVAGVARKIKIYDYANVMQQADAWNDLAGARRGTAMAAGSGSNSSSSGARREWWGEDAARSTMMQYPAAEFTNRSKISCLSFNPYIKAQLACSDYDGTVSLWDVGAGAATLSLGEHDKRAWSLDFSHVDPTRLCSGSDDGKVKVWATNRRASVMTIEGKANVCCVRFNPLHGNIVSFGSADHNVHCFDLRAPKQPLCVLRGHRKAVSYTRFLTPDEIISASTDSTLKLWNLRTQECVRTFAGHANEKNFVGLTTCAGDWIACGSENNAMYAYHRNLAHPAVTHRFGNCNPVTGAEQPDDDPSLFVSAVCWKSRSNTVVSANSQGVIKVLEMV
ncbi:hypothetical protein GGF46_004038 [Coemansia sp. RSA 552]|nr:hypothetical protein GGF46_004038 [Coemansia sp. RSA 552]